MDRLDLERRLDALASLAAPVRLALYHLRGQTEMPFSHSREGFMAGEPVVRSAKTHQSSSKGSVNRRISDVISAVIDDYLSR